LSRDRKLVPGADAVCVAEGDTSESVNASARVARRGRRAGPPHRDVARPRVPRRRCRLGHAICRLSPGRIYWRFANFLFPFWTQVPPGEFASHVHREHGADRRARVRASRALRDRGIAPPCAAEFGAFRGARRGYFVSADDGASWQEHYARQLASAVHPQPAAGLFRCRSTQLSTD
jgi:hypothetical protein